MTNDPSASSQRFSASGDASSTEGAARPPEQGVPASGVPERRLSLVDCTSIIVGIIIGSGIYRSMPDVAGSLTAEWQLPAIWILGGLFALVGSLCYAELATRMPVEGGDYAYLGAAFGRPVGFLFAWTQLWVIRPGSIGALACVFAAYAAELKPLGSASFLIYGCGSVVLLTVINALGVKLGTTTQNILTGAKVIGLAAVIVAGIMTRPHVAESTTAAVSRSWGGAFDALSFAMIFVLFAYSGWNEMGCVAAEVREPRKNILRALLLGAAVVAVIYVGLNWACARVLGLAAMATSKAVATDAVKPLLGDWGGRAIALLICVSALGSTNGMIFTGARIYYAMGSRHRGLGLLARWHAGLGTPVVSLVAQMLITLALLIAFGMTADVGSAGDAFERLVIFMTPPFYLFLILSALAVIVLRRREKPEASSASDGVFRMPLFPWPAIIVAAASAFMIYKGVMYIMFKYDASTLWAAVWVAATLVSGVVYIATVERAK